MAPELAVLESAAHNFPTTHAKKKGRDGQHKFLQHEGAQTEDIRPQDSLFGLHFCS